MDVPDSAEADSAGLVQVAGRSYAANVGNKGNPRQVSLLAVKELRYRGTWTER